MPRVLSNQQISGDDVQTSKLVLNQIFKVGDSIPVTQHSLKYGVIFVWEPKDEHPFLS